MLLLFLTLVLLGGSANGSQQSQSQNFLGLVDEGSNFVFSKEGQEVNGVRVQVGTSGYLSSLTWDGEYSAKAMGCHVPGMIGRIMEGSLLLRNLGKYIQVRHGTKWSARHGSTEGSLREVTLNKDESIVQVIGSNGNTKCLKHLTFVTDQGRKLEFGKAGPNQFTASSKESGRALSSIFGRYDSACLTGFAFEWIPVKKSKKEQTKTSTKQVSKSQISTKKG